MERSSSEGKNNVGDSVSISDFEIKKGLGRIRDKENIEILFAIENGSRAWGMESRDSDYDIRFVYRTALIDYIKLKQRKDVIQRNWENMGMEFDIQGFDIFKFAKLLIKSNPNMIEWCQSPIVYWGEVNPVMLSWIQENYNPIGLYHGYRSLAWNNYTKYIASGKQVTYKKYLYVIRGIFNALHVAILEEIPPMRLEDLRSNLTRFIPGSVSQLISTILEKKRSGEEREEIPLIFNRDELDKFINFFFALKLELPSKKVIDTKSIDDEIRKILLGELGKY